MNQRKSALVLSILAVMVAGMSCSRPEPASAIVAKAQAAGAGNLSDTSEASMVQWLAKHPDVSRQVEEMCKSVRPSAPAAWGDTTEGHLCRALARAAFFAPSTTTGDHRAYGAGNH